MKINDQEVYSLNVVAVRLVKDAPIMSGHPVKSPEDAVELIGKELCKLDREVVCILHLKADGKPISCTFASIGALDSSIAHPRELLKAAILSNASGMIIIHNHIQFVVFYFCSYFCYVEKRTGKLINFFNSFIII